MGEKKAGLVLAYCLPTTKGQSWFRTDRNELVLTKLLCLDASKSIPRLMKCHEMGGLQEWKLRDNDGKADSTAIYNMAAGMCLTVDTPKVGGRVQLGVCSSSSSSTSSWTLIQLQNDD